MIYKDRERETDERKKKKIMRDRKKYMERQKDERKKENRMRNRKKAIEGQKEKTMRDNYKNICRKRKKEKRNLDIYKDI